ncbi:MAG: hydroxyacylglutathione hydrolase [SAR86 cluster bacterium]|jgi:hydroxyacylglutathione hydrolase|nr:MAG: hydroxyacylglutathione hydrolase [SAR86 cluster bacterium]|tara:strand:+ start:695 stop:1423 length:729 start_codon:yes stop_codon:yes gene_type:complete
MKIFHIPAFTDNYIWCIQKNNKLAVVDPGDSKELLNLIKNNDLILEDILITHHHFDHTGGLEDLHNLVNGNIFGPKESNKFINKFVSENDEIEVLGNKYKILETPGHTLDHISYYSEDINSVFCGDTLFSGGCGRAFEGTYEQLHNSIQKLNGLPESTLIYAAHEYTIANLEFAYSVHADNAIIVHLNKAKKMISDNKITLPTKLSLEKKINLFLLENRPEHAKLLSDLDWFKELRERKDSY